MHEHLSIAPCMFKEKMKKKLDISYKLKDSPFSLQSKREWYKNINTIRVRFQADHKHHTGKNIQINIHNFNRKKCLQTWRDYNFIFIWLFAIGKVPSRKVMVNMKNFFNIWVEQYKATTNLCPPTQKVNSKAKWHREGEGKEQSLK